MCNFPISALSVTFVKIQLTLALLLSHEDSLDINIYHHQHHEPCSNYAYNAVLSSFNSGVHFMFTEY